MNTGNTNFASAEIADTESIRIDADILRKSGLAEQFIRQFPSVVLILNKQRQVVYTNQQLKDLLGSATDEEILGKRPGDLLNCIHANICQYGCGTTEFCSQCGAINAVLKAQQEKVTVVNECRIISTGGNAFDFRVWASPYHYQGKDYTLVSLSDIRHEKRRHALERMFFHDVNNLLSALLISSEMIDPIDVPDDAVQPIEIIKLTSSKLAAEILSYKKLLQAEDKRLELELEPDIKSLALVNELVLMFTPMKSKIPCIRTGICDDFIMTTDRSLLYRILHNMVKNAMEASPQDIITIGCFLDNNSGVFTVHNPAFMSRETQLQVFQRSFSTKGKGRGIGTYSMKLFGEEFLKGKVWFSSSKEEGTTFYISVPLSYDPLKK